jgi:hypothetical protein
MTLTIWMRLTAGVVVIGTIVAIGVAWRAEMRNRAELAVELATTKQALDAADTRQRDRDAKLADTLAAIAKDKQTVQSPAQIVQRLPKQMGLPVAITLQEVQPGGGGNEATNGSRVTGKAGSSGSSSFPLAKSNASPQAANVTSQDTPSPDKDASKVQAVIPGQDLKPLYDFALDCQACKAKLAASQSDLADEQGKTKALTKERDDALRVARGGNIFQRMARASKWMLIGAAAGAVAARLVH